MVGQVVRQRAGSTRHADEKVHRSIGPQLFFAACERMDHARREGVGIVDRPQHAYELFEGPTLMQEQRLAELDCELDPRQAPPLGPPGAADQPQSLRLQWASRGPRQRVPAALPPKRRLYGWRGLCWPHCSSRKIPCGRPAPQSHVIEVPLAASVQSHPTLVATSARQKTSPALAPVPVPAPALRPKVYWAVVDRYAGRVGASQAALAHTRAATTAWRCPGRRPRWVSARSS